MIRIRSKDGKAKIQINDKGHIEHLDKKGNLKKTYKEKPIAQEEVVEYQPQDFK